MYDSLRPELITATPAQRAAIKADPVAVVMRDMFFANAFPYLEVRRPFILGTRDQTWRATLSHRFAEMLHSRTGKLTRVYTQNIDGLDYQCSLPSDLVVPVHGTIGKVACEGCGAPESLDSFCDRVSANIKDLYNVDAAAPSESTPIPCKRCQRPLVKPVMPRRRRPLCIPPPLLAAPPAFSLHPMLPQRMLPGSCTAVCGSLSAADDRPLRLTASGKFLRAEPERYARGRPSHHRGYLARGVARQLTRVSRTARGHPSCGQQRARCVCMAARGVPSNLPEPSIHVRCSHPTPRT